MPPTLLVSLTCGMQRRGTSNPRHSAGSLGPDNRPSTNGPLLPDSKSGGRSKSSTSAAHKHSRSHYQPQLVIILPAEEIANPPPGPAFLYPNVRIVGNPYPHGPCHSGLQPPANATQYPSVQFPVAHIPQKRQILSPCYICHPVCPATIINPQPYSRPSPHYYPPSQADSLSSRSSTSSEISGLSSRTSESSGAYTIPACVLPGSFVMFVTYGYSPVTVVESRGLDDRH